MKRNGASSTRSQVFGQDVLLVLPGGSESRTLLGALIQGSHTGDRKDVFKSFDETLTRYRGLLHDARMNKLNLDNRDFDTGEATRAGEYDLQTTRMQSCWYKLAKKQVRRCHAGDPPEYPQFFIKI